MCAITTFATTNYAQTTLLSDDFEDGDLVGWTEGVVGHWTGSGLPALNGSFSLKHALTTGVDTSTIVQQLTTDPSTGDLTWRWQWKNGPWDPSSNNRFWFQLLSDQPNIKDGGANGYALGVQITSTGAADPIELHRIDGGVSGATLITAPTFDVAADSWYGFEVTRTIAGDWEVLIDNDGGFDALVSVGTATDATFAPVNPWVGGLFRFTTTRAGEFWLDDILVQSTAGGTPEVSLSVEKDTINEGHTVLVSVNATLPVDADKTFTLSTLGSAISGVDYNALPATITILNGQASASILLKTINDADFEGPEAIQITLGLNAQTNVTMGVAVQNVTITDYVSIMTHNLLYYGGEAPGSPPTPLSVTEKNERLAKIYEHTQPDLLAVNEIVTSLSTYGDSLLNGALNVGGVTWYAKAAYDVPSASPLSNMLYYDTRKFVMHSQTTITVPSQRLPNVYKLYYNYPDLAILQDTIWLTAVVTHMKAGSSASDLADRDEKSDSIISWIAKENIVNYVLLGDLNAQSDVEVGFQNLINHPVFPAASLNDPINTFGAWNNNAAFANVHTQSTRDSDLGDGGVFGGMDDRYDWIMTSTAMVNGTDRITNIPNSYWAVGQDGLRFNGNVISPLNTSVPDSIATALYESSDHLPVIMNLSFDHPSVGGTAPIVTTEPVSTDICEGQNTFFTVFASNASGYQWEVDSSGAWSSLIDNATFSGSSTNSVSIVAPSISLNGSSYRCIVTGPTSPNDTSAVVMLTLNSNSFDSISISMIDSFIAPSGAILTVSGNYIDTIPNAANCDSLIYIDLVITPSGISSFEKSELKLFPNPANNVIFIESSKMMSGYQIIDLTGRIVMSSKITLANSINIDTQSLINGVYQVKISIENGMEQTQRIVIQRAW
ncbi:MAG: hypothetical protein ACI9J3_000592 [Parvicellaceae bacterium]